MTASSPPTLVGVDVGTSAVRVAVFSSTGRLLGAFRAELERVGAGDALVGQDPMTWLRGIAAGLDALAAHLPSCAAIGITATTASVVPHELDLSPVGPALMWFDARAEAEAETLRQWLTEAGCEAVAHPWDELPKLLWCERRLTSKRPTGALDGAPWLVSKLVGRPMRAGLTAPYTSGLDRTGRLDQSTAARSPWLQRWSEIPVLTPFEVAGTIDHEGFEGASGLPVVLAGNDALVAAIGAGALSRPGIYEILGSSFVSFTVTGALDRGFEPGWQAHLPEAEALGAVGLAVREVELNWPRAPKWCRDVLDLDDAKVTVSELSQVTRSALSKAVERLDRAARSSAVAPACGVIVAGGCTARRDLIDLRYDAASRAGHRLHLHHDPHVGARGAAICAGVATGVLPDDDAVRQLTTVVGMEPHRRP